MNVALRPDQLHTLSLCTGGAGLELGLELAVPCARLVGVVEGEVFAVATVVEAMQDGRLAAAPVWSNARTFPGRRFRGCVDLVTAGYPCQPFSAAGRRRGADDPRHLWPSVRRVFVQSGAWAMFLENVEGHLSLGFDQVLRDLRRVGCEVEAGLFTAEEVGASHIRKRLFILAVADARCPAFQRRGGDLHLVGTAGGGEVEGDKRQWDGPPLGYGGEVVADGDRQWQRQPQRSFGQVARWPLDPGEGVADTERYGRRKGPEPLQPRAVEPEPTHSSEIVAYAGLSERRPWPARGRGTDRANDGGQEGSSGPPEPGPLFPPGPGDIDLWRAVLAERPEVEPAVRRMADGVASRVDRLRLLGNGVVPLEAAHAFRALATSLARRSAGAAELVRMMST